MRSKIEGQVTLWNFKLSNEIVLGKLQKENRGIGYMELNEQKWRYG